MKRNDVLSMFRSAAEKAALKSMKMIRPHQTGEKVTAVNMKADQTPVTEVDYRSTEIVTREIKKYFPDIAVTKEDGEDEIGEGNYRLIIDGIDGTGPFSVGMGTSTVIIALFDTSEKQVIACTVGDPALGRIWSATANAPTTLSRESNGEIIYLGNKKLADSELQQKAPVVFVDILGGYTHPSYSLQKTIEPMTRPQQNALFSFLNESYTIFISGSNALNIVLIANGADRAAGTIVTAASPWDFCPVLLVLKADGFARAFSVTASRRLEEQNPLEVYTYDFLVVGKTEEIVNKLSEGLRDVFSI